MVLCPLYFTKVLLQNLQNQYWKQNLCCFFFACIQFLLMPPRKSKLVSPFLLKKDRQNNFSRQNNYFWIYIHSNSIYILPLILIKMHRIISWRLLMSFWHQLCIPLCVIFMILVSLENVKKCVLGGCTITSKTKINIFWKNFFTSTLRSKFFQKTLTFEANIALSRENETKIVKITHSVSPTATAF